MAPFSKIAEKQGKNTTTSKNEEDLYISDCESELDAYIVSIPKQFHKAEDPEPKQTPSKLLEVTKELRDPLTPQRTQRNPASQYLTPRSLVSTRSKPRHSTPVNVEDAALKTPSKTSSKKARGVFGTDARVWSAKGHKSPCRTLKYEEK